MDKNLIVMPAAGLLDILQGACPHYMEVEAVEAYAPRPGTWKVRIKIECTDQTAIGEWPLDASFLVAEESIETQAAKFLSRAVGSWLLECPTPGAYPQ
jgi:hypothetical protein